MWSLVAVGSNETQPDLSEFTPGEHWCILGKGSPVLLHFPVIYWCGDFTNCCIYLKKKGPSLLADLCSTSQHSALLFSVRKTFSLPLGFPPVGHWRRMCTREGLVIGLFHLLQLAALFCCTVGNVFSCKRTVNEMQKDKLFWANISAGSMSVYCYKVLAKARQLRIESIVKEKNSLRLTLCICKICILELLHHSKSRVRQK